MAVDPLVVVEGVGKTIGETVLLKDVSLILVRGEALAVIGPSGSGKTTLLRLIAGLEEPTSGRVSIAGRVVSQRGRVDPPWDRGIGMVFQQASLWPHMTVAENVAFGLNGQAKSAAARRLDEVMALTHLVGLGARRPHQLSGGEAQRAALARAIAPRPGILLLDEPLSGLDPELHASMVELFLEVRRETRVTMLYVTHNHEEAKTITDRALCLRKGCVEHQGEWPRPEQDSRE